MSIIKVTSIIVFINSPLAPEHLKSSLLFVLPLENGIVALDIHKHQFLCQNNLPVDKHNLHFIWSEFQMAKSHDLPFHLFQKVSTLPLDLIFSDVWGPSFVVSTTGAKYYVSFLNDYSKFVWLFPMKIKSGVKLIFLQFQAYVEKHFERKIKAIQSD